MTSCCESKSEELALLRNKQRIVLIIVLVINAVMFFVEFTFGILSKSTALLADSLDMLGDATVYAFSLYVINKNQKWKAYAALLKGLLISIFGLFVFYEATNKMFSDILPITNTMGYIGTMALIANITCLALLLKHKEDDINMRSTWICSRNDIIANIGVITAAICVSYFNSKWPDIMIGLILATLFLRSSFSIIKESMHIINK